MRLSSITSAGSVFRLSTVTLKVPPLRERSADMMMPADHFLQTYAGKRAVPPPASAANARNLHWLSISRKRFRELEGEMARLVAMCPREKRFLQVRSTTASPAASRLPERR